MCVFLNNKMKLKLLFHSIAKNINVFVMFVDYFGIVSHSNFYLFMN